MDEFEMKNKFNNITFDIINKKVLLAHKAIKYVNLLL